MSSGWSVHQVLGGRVLRDSAPEQGDTQGQTEPLAQSLAELDSKEKVETTFGPSLVNPRPMWARPRQAAGLLAGRRALPNSQLLPRSSLAPRDWLYPSWHPSQLGAHVSRSSQLPCPFTQ